jgi:hypothetical protein
VVFDDFEFVGIPSPSTAKPGGAAHHIATATIRNSIVPETAAAVLFS